MRVLTAEDGKSSDVHGGHCNSYSLVLGDGGSPGELSEELVM